jgi:far upstream element-binding protein
MQVEEVLFNPEKAQQIKSEQLRALNDEKSAVQKYTGGGVGGSAMTTDEDGECTLQLQIPNHLVGYLIGKSGEPIQKLQRETGAHCQIAKECEMRPGDTMRSVVLRGSEGGVREATRMVDELVQEKLQGGAAASGGMGGGREDKRPRDNQDQLDRYSMLLKVAVPNEKVGLIIGKQGATVKSIQEKTMTFIHIPGAPDEDDPNVRTLSIGGDTR